MPQITLRIDINTDKVTALQARAFAPHIAQMAAEARQQKDAQKFLELTEIHDILRSKATKKKRPKKAPPVTGTTASPATTFARTHP